MDKLSIIVPCYNEEESIRLFYDEVEKQVLPVEKEYIFINDGSRDNTLNELRKLAKEDSRVRYESFTRNFGKEAGLYAFRERPRASSGRTRLFEARRPHGNLHRRPRRAAAGRGGRLNPEKREGPQRPLFKPAATGQTVSSANTPVAVLEIGMW